MPPAAIEDQYIEVEDSGCPPDLVADIDRLREQLGFPADHPAWLEVLLKQGVRSVAEMTPQAANQFRFKLAALTATEEPVLNTFTRPSRQAELGVVTPPTPDALEVSALVSNS
jgi:hypothetical protein